MESTRDALLQERYHEEDLQRLRGFRPIDDTFMRCLFRDNLPLAQMVLRIITGKQDLVLTREETQKDLKRLLGARSLCLDVHGVDSEDREYDLEVNEIPLNATLIGSKSIFTAQKSKGNSVFAEASYIGNYECDVLVKPFSRTEVEGMLQNFKTEHGGQDPQDTAAQLADELEHNALTIKKGKEIEETANYSVKYTTINQNKDLKPEKKAEKLSELEKKHKSTLIKIEADCNKKISRKHIIKHFYAGRECFVLII